MFYIECRGLVDKEDQEKHIKECINVPDTPRQLNDLVVGEILYPLCQKDDVNSFKNALEKYKEYLSKLLITDGNYKSRNEIKRRRIAFWLLLL